MLLLAGFLGYSTEREGAKNGSPRKQINLKDNKVKRLAGRLGGARETGEFLGDQNGNVVSGVGDSLSFG